MFILSICILHGSCLREYLIESWFYAGAKAVVRLDFGLTGMKRQRRRGK